MFFRQSELKNKKNKWCIYVRRPGAYRRILKVLPQNVDCRTPCRGSQSKAAIWRICSFNLTYSLTLEEQAPQHSLQPNSSLLNTVALIIISQHAQRSNSGGSIQVMSSVFINFPLFCICTRVFLSEREKRYESIVSTFTQRHNDHADKRNCWQKRKRRRLLPCCIFLSSLCPEPVCIFSFLSFF